MTRYDGMAFQAPEIKENEHAALQCSKRAKDRESQFSGDVGQDEGVYKVGKRQEQRRHSYVYFIRSEGGSVKIGCSNKPHGRLMQTTEWVPSSVRLEAVIPGGLRLESLIQRKFAKDRIGGEWFHTSPELEALIEDAKNGKPILINDADVQSFKLWNEVTQLKVRLGYDMTVAERKFYGRRVWNRRPKHIQEMQDGWKGAHNGPTEAQVAIARDYIDQLRNGTFVPHVEQNAPTPDTSFAAFLIEPEPEA